MGNRMEIQVGHFSYRPTWEHRIDKTGNWNEFTCILISIRDDHGHATFTIEEPDIKDENGNYSQIWHSDKDLLEFVCKSVYDPAFSHGADDAASFLSIFEFHLENGRALMLNCNWIDGY